MREATITLDNCDLERVLGIPPGVYPVAAWFDSEKKQLLVRVVGDVPDSGTFQYSSLIAAGYAGWGVDHA